MAGGRGTVVVVATAAAAWRRVAGLALAVRAARAARVAGGDVAVFAPAAPPEAMRELAGGGVALLGDPGEATGLGAGPVLLLAGDVLADPAALGALLGLRPQRGECVAVLAEGVVVALACGEGVGPRVLAALASGASLGEAAGAEARRVGVTLPGDALLVAADAGGPPEALEAFLLDHLARRTATGDSYVAAVLDRRLSRPVTRWLLRRGTAPARITLASIALGLLGGAALATTGYETRVTGVLLLVASLVLDCVDGEVARARLEESPEGARLDLAGDYLVHLATFLGLGIGLGREGLSPAGVACSVALVLGVLASMAVAHVAFVRPALTRGGDLHWEGDADSLRETALGVVAEKLASRDYTYLLLVLALLGRLDWFLYAAALGAWGFAVGLVLYWAYRRRVAAGVAEGR